MSVLDGDGDSDQMIDKLVGEYLDRRRRGERPSIAEYAARHPELEPGLGDLLAAAVQLDDAGGAGLGDQALPLRIADYRIVGEIGRGGMGVVYEAVQESLGRRVALKVLSSPRMADPRTLVRFRREAGVASRLEHPGICTVHATGVDAGIPYIAMGFVDGQPLSRLIDTASEGATSLATLLDSTPAGSSRGYRGASGPPTPQPARLGLESVLQLMIATARAVHAAHEAGIIHRDIKPANILVNSEGRPVVCDFGLAQEVEGADALTRSGELVGTLAYMAPEQVLGQTVDRHTDVYGLGATLFEALTLRRPFEAPTREVLCRAITSESLPDARKLNAEISRDLRTVLETALSRDRNRRYATASDFAEDLERILERRPILARPISPAGRLWRWIQRHPTRAALIATLAVGLPLLTGLAVHAVLTRPAVEEQARRDLAERVERELEAGCYELNEGVLARAVTAFRQALALDPSSIEARAALALALDLEGNVDEALELLEGRPDAFVALPALRLIRDELLAKRAGPEPPFAQPVTPRSALGWFYVGLILSTRAHADLERGDFEAVARAMRNAVLTASKPRRLFHFELAHAVGHIDDTRLAQVVAQALITLWPESIDAWKWAGWALTPTDPENALAAYREAIRRSQVDPVALRGVIRTASALGRDDEALQAARCLVEVEDPDPNILVVSATYLLKRYTQESRTELPEAAARLLRTALTRRPTHYGGLYNLAISLMELGELDEACRVAQQAVEVEPERANGQNVLGTILIELNLHAEAIETLRRAIALDSEYHGSHFNLGRALEKRGERDAAIEAYRTAIALEPDYGPAHQGLGRGLMGAGEPEEALAPLRQAVALEPDDAAARFYLGTCLTDLDRDAEASRELRRATELDHSDPAKYFNLAIVLEKLRRYREARDAMVAAAERGRGRSDWNDEPVHRQLRQLEALAAREQRLEDVIGGAAAPADPEELAALAILAYRQRRFLGAARLLEIGLERDPHHLFPRLAAQGVTAGCAALSVAAHPGPDGRPLDGEARRAWRLKARRWLRLELRFWEEKLDAGRARSSTLRKILEEWQELDALSPVRDDEHLRQLPPDERKAWTRLWIDVDALVARLDP